MALDSDQEHKLTINLSTDPTLLGSARTAIEKLAATHKFDAQSCEEIGLVVNEALANVIRHAYGVGTDGPIQIDVIVLDGELTIKMRDWGKGVNPDKLPPSPASIDPLKPGGLGLMCMRRMMDSVVFEPQPDGMLLTMKRKRAVRDATPTVAAASSSADTRKK
ncbi:MAG: ATP-binding protein [Anaerolineae bacterium]|nr:ATP-binding protein [Phycisphaerae bacterium]